VDAALLEVQILVLGAPEESADARTTAFELGGGMILGIPWQVWALIALIYAAWKLRKWMFPFIFCHRVTGHACFVPIIKGRRLSRRLVWRCLCGFLNCQKPSLRSVNR
jgi:hypothetical protein